MPTLESLNGRTLGAGIGNLAQDLIKQFQGQADRSRALTAAEVAEEERLAKQASIQEQVGILSGQAPGVDPGFARTAETEAALVARAAEQARLTKQHQQRQQQAFIRLSSLDPTIATAVKGALQRGDKAEIAQLQQQTDQGVRMSSVLLNEKDPIKRRAKALELVKLQAANGQDPRRGLDLINMPPEKFNLALQKMQVAGTAIKTLTTPLEPPPSRVSKPSPDKFTGDSLDKFEASGNFADLALTPEAQAALARGERVQAGRSQLFTDKDGNIQIATPVTTSSGETRLNVNKIPGQVVSSFGETPEQQTARVIGEAGGKEKAKLTETLTFTPSIETAKARSKGKEGRVQTSIAKGLDQVQALPVINRSIQLLDSIPTGGIDQAQLKAKQFFGIEGADEAELSANLGKAVMSQLRTVFGAAFTAQEGQSLARIEAGFGKSTEGNKRLLRQTKKLIITVVNRSIKDAVAVGDFRSAAEMQEQMQLNLDPNVQEQAPAAQTPGQGQTVGRFQIRIK